MKLKKKKDNYNKRLNEIIEIYNSPNLNILFKDIIGKELFEILKKSVLALIKK